MKLPAILGGARRGLFVRLVLNALAQASFLLVTAILIRLAFDHLLGGNAVNLTHIWGVGSGLAASAAASGWLRRSERVIAEKLGQSYVHSLRRKLFQNIVRMDPRQLEKRRRGSVMLRFIGDLNAVRRWVSLGVVRIIVSGAIVAATLWVLSQIDSALSLLTACIIAVAGAADIRIGYLLRQAAMDVRKRRAHLSAVINEKISQMAVVQAFGQGQREINHIRRKSHRLRLSQVHRAGRIGLLRGINHGVTAIMTATVLIAGVIRVNSGSSTPGTIAAAIAVMGFLVPALRDLGRIYEYYQDATVARQKIRSFFAIRSSIGQGDDLPDLAPGPGKIVLEGIVVPGVLDSISGLVEAGRKVAIVGPNGMGKSTLLALIGSMIKPQHGRVLIDGQDTAECRLTSVRNAIGMVGPDLPLMAGSLEMNIRYGCPDCPPEEIERVIDACGLDTLIQALPDGLRTRIHERGGNLSSGQRQRIALARALLGSPRILLLDEVDAHLDAEACKLFIDTIRAYPGTVLWVTHLADAFSGMDAVWKIENGAISIRCPDAPRLKAVG